ncbi:insulinase family protein [Colwellia sp. Arc7-635]|uniref:M16 family metallopeptidase n=1 Tax=Colwellia sp. Arc7-635 TaxID=2497879 RepID=UPI000F859B9E|nr:M16 family metallopeptidase [Colwellia sp. Arc7-635]AZQ83796.1 insulinase family protein [Colwellia sp. Arc7-635]
MKNIFIILFVVTFLTACVRPHNKIETTAFDQPLLTQIGVVEGEMNNGLRYIILPNNKPANQVSLKMMVNAGSMHEQDDQKGIAHLVEHMAFNGTTLYPANSIIEKQESLGLVFGRDVNATTSYDTTSYYLHLPASTDALLNEAFQMLSQQASALNFEQSELEKERPVVEEEWRRMLSMRARLSDKIQKITMSGSRYVERNPIGDMNLVRHVNAERIKAFWNSWYHPNNMVFVAVGDITESQVKTLLKKHFGHMKNTPLPKRPDFSISVPNEISLHAVSDKELVTESIMVNFISEEPQATSKQELRKQLIRELALTMFQDRLRFQYQAGGKHVNKLFVFSSEMASKYVNTRLFGILGEDNYLDAIREMFSELSRFAHHGFTQYELNVVKQVLTKEYDMAFENESSVLNAALLHRVSSYVQKNMAIISQVEKLTLQKKLLNSIGIDEVNRYLKVLVEEREPLVIAQVKPENEHKLPTKLQIKAAWQQSMKTPPAKLSRVSIDKPLFTKVLPPVNVISHEVFDQTHVWKLANNTQVWFQPSDKWPDTLLLKWQGIGGTQHLEQKDRRIAQIAVSQLPRFGYAGFDVMQLELVNAGKSINIGAFINQQVHQLSGSSATDSFETWLQNFYLQLTSPQTNRNIWQTNKNMMLKGIEGAENLPHTLFTKQWNNVLFTHNPSLKMLKTDELNSLNSEDLLTAWKSVFGSAEQHQLIIVGNADPEWVIKVASQYIGNLPQGQGKSKVKLPPLSGSDKVVVVNAGEEPKATALMYWLVDYPFSETLSRQASILSRIISTRIREQLRETAGGIYTSSFSITADQGREQLMASLRYNHQPERASELQQLALNVIKELTAHGITESELHTVKEQKRNFLNAENISDGSRLRWLSKSATNGEYVSMPSNYLEWLDSLTADELLSIAKKLLTEPISLDARLMPKDISAFSNSEKVKSSK